MQNKRRMAANSRPSLPTWTASLPENALPSASTMELWRYSRSLWFLYCNDIHVTEGVVATCGRRASCPDLAPFSYISTQKLSFNDKVWTYYRILVSKRVKSQKTGKTGPRTNPATAPPQKFVVLLRYNLFMGVNEMRVKILPLLCRLGLVLRLGSV